MKESLSFCIPGMHLIEIHYNSSFIYEDSIYVLQHLQEPNSSIKHGSTVFLEIGSWFRSQR
jgi:hypothetical protein